MDKSERSENLVKSELLRACKLLYRQKLVYATAGNVSHRCGDSIFITATGTSLGYVTPDSLVRLDMDGVEREMAGVLDREVQRRGLSYTKCPFERVEGKTRVAKKPEMAEPQMGM